MSPGNLSGLVMDELQVKLLNAGKAIVGQKWNFSNIVSPFTRIYYINDGEGYITPGNKLLKLKPRHLYLIPSYVQCDYSCSSLLSQFYIHLTNEFTTGLNIYDFLTVINEVPALEFDRMLFRRLTFLHPDAALKHSDPEQYKFDSWTSSGLSSSNSSVHLETTGILKQLLSRFMIESKVQAKSFQQFSHFRKVFQYINAHLHEEIRIETLAKIACYSYDHFTRVFKKTTNMLPVKYINLKKIEKAQILLLTTGMSQKEICDKTGFNNLPYYYRVFQKHAGCTPVQYRKLGGLI